MSKFFWLAAALVMLGFVSGCGGSSMPTEAPPHDPALDNVDDESEYDLPEDEDPSNAAAPTQ